MRNSLRGGSVSLFMGLMLANAFAYGYHMVMARMMAPSDYGVLVTLTSISYVLAVFARTLQAWVIKAVATKPDVSAGHVRAVFRVGIRSVILLGSLILLALWVANRWVADFLHLGTRAPVMVLGVYAFTSLLTPLPRGVLLGLDRLHLAGIIYPLESLARLIGGIVLLTWGLGVNGALASYAFGELLAFLIALIALGPLLHGHDDHNRLGSPITAPDPYPLFVLTTNIILMLMANIDQIAVKHFFSEQVAGNYAVAFLLGRIIVLTTMALSWILFARAANVPPDDSRQTRLFIKGLLVTGLTSVSLTAGYFAAPRLAIRFMGGAQYDIADAYVGLVGLEMSLFALVYIQVYYLMSLKQMHIVWPLLLAIAVEFIVLAQYHANVEQILFSIIAVTGILLIWVSGSCWFTLRSHASPAAAALRETPRTVADIG